MEPLEQLLPQRRAVQPGAGGGLWVVGKLRHDRFLSAFWGLHTRHQNRPAISVRSHLCAGSSSECSCHIIRIRKGGKSSGTLRISMGRKRRKWVARPVGTTAIKSDFATRNGKVRK